MAALTLAPCGPRFADSQLEPTPKSGAPVGPPPDATSPPPSPSQIPNPQSEIPKRPAKRGQKKAAPRVKQLKELLPRKVPKDRDLRIYEYVVFQQISQYDVAHLFGITQPRVCQIVEKVRLWKGTIPWEIPGMTEEQQVNLATHETRRWLEVVRDKAFKYLKDAEQDLRFLKIVTEKQPETQRQEEVQRIDDIKPQTPKSGFLNIALRAVIKGGELGGAGQQWGKGSGLRVQGRGCQEPGIGSQEPGIGSQEPGARGQEPGARDQEPGARDQEPGAAGNSEPEFLNPEPAALNPPERLLKEKPAAFTPHNGKANGHKSSVMPDRAQVQQRRRQKKRQNAYQAAANRAGIQAPASRHRFLQLLRQLDRLAENARRAVERQSRSDARHGRAPMSDWHAEQLRVSRLRELLDLNREVDFHLPYDRQWVDEQYDAASGLFRWQLEIPPPEEKPQDPPASQAQKKSD